MDTRGEPIVIYHIAIICDYEKLVSLLNNSQQQINQRKMLKTIKNMFFSSKSEKVQPKDKLISKMFIEMSQKYSDCKVIRWKDGTVYVGESSRNDMQGFGKLIFPNGDYYQGEFVDNQFQGQGKYVGSDGYYEGAWKNGLKQGCGKEKNGDGSSFTGKYQKGCKQGFGYFQWSDGSFYQGMFKQDYMQGPGKMVHADGSQIEGEWHQNQINGICRQITADGNVYIGTLKNGLRNGSGLLIQKHRKIQGKWKNDILDGIALVQQNDGICLCINSEEGVSKLIDDCEYQRMKDVTIQ